MYGHLLSMFLGIEGQIVERVTNQEGIGFVTPFGGHFGVTVQTVQILRAGLCFGNVNIKLGSGKPLYMDSMVVPAQYNDDPHGLGLSGGQINEQRLDLKLRLRIDTGDIWPLQKQGQIFVVLHICRSGHIHILQVNKGEAIVRESSLF